MLLSLVDQIELLLKISLYYSHPMIDGPHNFVFEVGQQGDHLLVIDSHHIPSFAWIPTQACRTALYVRNR